MEKSEWKRMVNGELVLYDDLPEEIKSMLSNDHNGQVLVERDLVAYQKVLLVTRINRVLQRIPTTYTMITKEDVENYIMTQKRRKKKKSA